MKILKAAVAAMLLFVAGATFVRSAQADAWDKQTTVTFARTVEMPGLILPAGTYVFKVDRSVRNLVRVYNQDESMVLASILTISDERLKPTEKTMIQINEQPAGQRGTVQAWFYPSEAIGRAFVYPK